MALPALTEDIVEEILLRVPPDEPAHLIHAALVCKPWLRILIADPAFRRRYRRHHRTPPLLGYIHNVRFYGIPKFVPTTSFSPPPTAAGNYPCRARALDCRHGRVLIHDTGPHVGVMHDDAAPPAGLIVWDPITGDRQQVNFPADHDHDGLCSFAGAVLCARHGCGCDHLDCHGGPFIVVYVGINELHDTHTWATVYSSETGAWSAQTSSSTDSDIWNFPPLKPSILIGDAIYFCIMCPMIRILKYDLSGHGLSMVVDAPKLLGKVAPIDVGGRLGLVESNRNRIYTWSRPQAAGAGNGVGGGWVRHTAAELETLIPTRRRSRYQDRLDDVIRFVEGTDTIIFSLDNNIDRGVFTFDLKSRQVRKVAERWDYDILPYVSFYTPGFAKGKLSLS